MTKKHFIALADAIREFQYSHSAEADIQYEEIHLNHLADFCQAQNPQFNRERWLGYIAGTNGKNGGKL
jgi:hypothetical protein